MTRMSGLFAIVTFDIDDSLSVVPTSWLDGKVCYWPQCGSQLEMDKLVKTQVKPDKQWKKYSVRILGIKDSYNRARTQLSLAEETSDLETEKENSSKKRRVRIPHRFTPDAEVVQEFEMNKTAKRRVTLREKLRLAARSKFVKRFKKASAREVSVNGLHDHPSAPKAPRLVLSPLNSDSKIAATNDVDTSRATNADGTLTQSNEVELISALVNPQINRTEDDITFNELEQSSDGEYVNSNACDGVEGQTANDAAGSCLMPRADICLSSSPRTVERSAVVQPPTVGLCETPLVAGYSTSVGKKREVSTVSCRGRSCLEIGSKQISPANNPSDIAVNKVFLTLLLEIKTSISEMNTRITNLSETVEEMKSSSITPFGSSDKDDLLQKLPLANDEDLDYVEEQLRNDTDRRTQWIVMLARQGGKNVRKMTAKLLKFLISNDLMKKMNWTGQGGKIPFCKLELVQLVYEAVRRNRTTATATNDDVQAEVVRFLHGASDREGGKTERMKRKLLSQP